MPNALAALKAGQLPSQGTSANCIFIPTFLLALVPKT